jgi:hypothetical protein
MKSRLIPALFLLVVTLSAQNFPGLKAVLSEAEWKRAGLDRLTPDQIGVIDAALIRQQAGVVARHQGEIAAVRSAAPVASVASTAQAASPGFMQRFGLPLFDDSDWRSMPPLRAKVVKWEGGNRFRLDNGQLWEGHEPITYDLPGKQIEIQARPHGQFALVVDGMNTTLRVMRLR